ncbi:hypothetical protein NF98_13885 [Salmonella enterica subsp. enterica serovar Rubislaw]|nr:hypothetical protein [Salmonella enterica]EBL5122803.1 hypothetical protein [Salmonella enterica subsp. enterica serovar Rubislaw]
MQRQLKQLKKSLNAVIAGCYIALAITVLMVGRCNPEYRKATTDAASVFFIVATLFAFACQIMAWRMLSSLYRIYAVLHSDVHHATMSMVAQAGQLSGWPVPFRAGIATPAWAIASERCNSSDSVKTIERRLPSWLQPQPQNTQNPRSPNSVTTVAVSFIAHRWWYFICTSSIWTVMKKRCSCIFLTFFPTSTTILRL